MVGFLGASGELHDGVTSHRLKAIVNFLGERGAAGVRVLSLGVAFRRCNSGKLPDCRDRGGQYGPGSVP